jgi:hypothetical protein
LLSKEKQIPVPVPLRVYRKDPGNGYPAIAALGELSGGGEPGQCLSETLVADMEGGAKRGACEAAVAGLLEGIEDGGVEVCRRGLLHLLLFVDDAQVHVLFVAEEGEGDGLGSGGGAVLNR